MLSGASSGSGSCMVHRGTFEVAIGLLGSQVTTGGAVARVFRQGGTEQRFALLGVSAEERRELDEEGPLGDEYLGIVGVECQRGVDLVLQATDDERLAKCPRVLPQL